MDEVALRQAYTTAALLRNEDGRLQNLLEESRGLVPFEAKPNVSHREMQEVVCFLLPGRNVQTKVFESQPQVRLKNQANYVFCSVC